MKEDFSQFAATSMEVLQKDIPALAADPNVLYVSPDGALTEKKDNKGKGRAGDDDDDTLLSADKLLEEQLKLLSRIRPKKVKADWDVPEAKDLPTTYPIDVNAPAAWSKHLTGAGVTVAVLDTGVNPFHPGHRDKVYPVFVNPNSTGYLDGSATARTSRASSMAATTTTSTSVLRPNAASSASRSPTTRAPARESDLLRGLLWVYENRLRVQHQGRQPVARRCHAAELRASPIDAAVEHCGRPASRSSPRPVTAAPTRAPRGSRRATIRS